MRSFNIFELEAFFPSFSSSDSFSSLRFIANQSLFNLQGSKSILVCEKRNNNNGYQV